MDPVSVPGLDEEAMIAAAERQDVLTKPPGALGRLEALSVWFAGTQAACPPRQPQRVRVVVFAGDHGVAGSGVSAFPSDVTAQMVANFVAGGAAVNVMAAHNGATVRVVDLSVDAETPAEVSTHKVRRGSGDISHADALMRDEAEAAFTAGRRIADEEIDAGADLLIPGDMGIGNTTVAAAIVAAVCGLEPVVVVGRGTGIDDAGWARKVAAVRDALRRVRSANVARDPIGLLAVAGGADFAAMTGFLVQAAARRTPVILDGIVSCTCAVLANEIAPGSAAWQIAGHRSTEPAQAHALARLQHEPLIDARMRLGEGTGALLALPMLRAAIATLAEMATFGEAGVSERDG
ncbi:MAG TPA: nicotinate-nucleotide--dimethylbenzimidazole phosphoribosyltransferase [Mycobacteriales bacterium]|nr:nicotinate-nucleotide--dimethylbenzimidazole phosphoribosyltransferase [Mycobacteriales bacterium]